MVVIDQPLSSGAVQLEAAPEVRLGEAPAFGKQATSRPSSGPMPRWIRPAISALRRARARSRQERSAFGSRVQASRAA